MSARTLWQTRPPVPVLPEPELLTESVVRLPELVLEAACLDFGGNVTFDFSATRVLTKDAVRGLLRTCRLYRVTLRIPAGPVLPYLRTLFTKDRVRHIGGVDYRLDFSDFS